MTEQTDPDRYKVYYHNVPQQMEMALALHHVLGLAHKRGLPSISWTIHDLGFSLVARDLRTVSIQDKERNHAAYVDLLQELHDKSVAKYGPGNAEYRLSTKLTVWDPAKTTHGDVTRLGANLEHFSIDLGRNRRVRLLNLFVGADLDRALDKDEEAQA